MTKITGELDLSHVPTESYDAKLGLRVAVFRDGKQLGSTDLNAPATPAQRVPFTVDFQPINRAIGMHQLKRRAAFTH